MVQLLVQSKKLSTIGVPEGPAHWVRKGAGPKKKKKRVLCGPPAIQDEGGPGLLCRAGPQKLSKMAKLEIC